ncbi:MAG TPA: hypothetical protein PK566_04420 [Pseudobacteroides sp.]|nr:hypothetical protein [Pseudobacteroides sp.]
MSFKITISGGIKLEKCIESVVCRADPPDDYVNYTNVDNYICITGIVGSDESTAALYQWALLNADDPNAYREVIVEEFKEEVLIRKIVFDNAFVIKYEESYSNSTSVGSFELYIKQAIGNIVQCTSSEIQKSQSVANSDVPSISSEETISQSTLNNDTDKNIENKTPNNAAKDSPSKPVKLEKTIKDVEDFAIKNNLADKVNYNGLDPKVADELNKSISETIKQFPELRDNLHFIGSAQERNNFIRESLESSLKDAYIKANPNLTWADLEPHVQKKVDEYMSKLEISPNTIAQSMNHGQFGGITINNDFGSDFDKFKEVKEKDVKAQWKPIGCDSIKATVDHELGHQLDDMLKVSSDPEIVELYNKLKDEDTIKDQLSGYSATSIKEFVAEGWSEYRNNPEPRDVAKKIGEKITGGYEEWKKTK